MILNNFVLWSCLAGALAVLADRNITIDDLDRRVVYRDSWNHDNSYMAFDRLNSTTSYTFQAGASASLKFNGTAIYFMSYGIPPPEQDTYQVTFNGKSEVHSLRVGINKTRTQFMGYRRTGLDASEEHTIIISNIAGTALNVDAFIITVPDDSTMKDGFVPFSEASTSDEQPGGQSEPTTYITVGTVAAVVGIFVGLLGALGIYLWRRRKNRDSTLNLLVNVEGGTAPFQSAGAPNASPSARLAGITPFEWVSGGVSTQHEMVREDRRPNREKNGVPEGRNDAGSPPPYAG